MHAVEKERKKKVCGQQTSTDLHVLLKEEGIPRSSDEERHHAEDVQCLTSSSLSVGFPVVSLPSARIIFV